MIRSNFIFLLGTVNFLNKYTCRGTTRVISTEKGVAPER